MIPLLMIPSWGFTIPDPTPQYVVHHKTKTQIKKEFTQKEIECLTDNVYREAAYEPEEGQVAVAQVTINRTHRTWYPKTICGVVYEKDQFSWTRLDNLPKKDPSLYNQIKKLATLVFTNKKKSDIIGTNVLYFHADYIDPPPWTENCVLVAQIGTHIFYAREKDFEYN